MVFEVVDCVYVIESGWVVKFGDSGMIKLDFVVCVVYLGFEENV